MTAPAHDPARAAIDAIRARVLAFPKRHFLSAGDLNAPQATDLLDLADAFVAFNRQTSKSLDLLRAHPEVREKLVEVFNQEFAGSNDFEVVAFVVILPDGETPA